MRALARPEHAPSTASQAAPVVAEVLPSPAQPFERAHWPGHDFSRVAVHTDARPAPLRRQARPGAGSAVQPPFNVGIALEGERICAGVLAPLTFVLSVDTPDAPRPPGSANPNVTIDVQLEPAERREGLLGEINRLYLVFASGEAEYQGPGEELKPTFAVPRFIPPEVGTLHVRVVLDDPIRPDPVVFTDMLPVERCPRPPAVGRRLLPSPSARAYQLPDLLIVSTREPRSVRWAGPYEYLERHEAYARVWFDPGDGRYFYYDAGRPIYLPEDWEEQTTPRYLPEGP